MGAKVNRRRSAQSPASSSSSAIATASPSARAIELPALATRAVSITGAEVTRIRGPAAQLTSSNQRCRLRRGSSKAEDQTGRALTNRREPATGLVPPILKALAIALVPLALIALATELPGLQGELHTESLTGRHWLACLGLAALLPLVIEGRKWLLRR